MPDTIGQLVAQLSQTNIELWHEEDRARANDYADAKECKKRIDVLNQRRNDLVQRLDELMQLQENKRWEGNNSGGRSYG